MLNRERSDDRCSRSAQALTLIVNLPICWPCPVSVARRYAKSRSSCALGWCVAHPAGVLSLQRRSTSMVDTVMKPAFAPFVIAAVSAGVPPSAFAQELDPDSIVRSIHQDARGGYWFGTLSEGVYRFDGHVLTLYTEQEGLANNQVRNILEDPEGTIWFETASGVSRYDGHSIRTITDRDYTARHDWQLNDGDLWFKGDRSTGFTALEGEPGTYRLNGSTLRFHVFPLELPPEEHDDYSVTEIHRAKGSRVWIATYDAVIGFDGDEFVVIDDASLGHTGETGSLHVRSVFEDSKGRLWIGNNGIGVIMRDATTTINFTEAQGVSRRENHGDTPEGKPSLDRVFSINEDRDGNIWFGTRDQGAWRFDGTSLRQFTEQDGLQTTMVWDIYTDQNGNLLVGGQGVFRFNGTRFERML